MKEFYPAMLTANQTKIKTHAKINLNVNKPEERYGNRVRSRMRELFNLIAFEKKH
jgi:hypothetical protein